MADPALEMHMLRPEEALGGNDNRLVDTIDALLECGVVIRGELWLSVAEVDLVFLGLDLVLANPDTIRDRQKVPA